MKVQLLIKINIVKMVIKSVKLLVCGGYLIVMCVSATPQHLVSVCRDLLEWFLLCIHCPVRCYFAWTVSPSGWGSSGCNHAKCGGRECLQEPPMRTQSFSLSKPSANPVWSYPAPCCSISVLWTQVSPVPTMCPTIGATMCPRVAQTYMTSRQSVPSSVWT